MARCGHAPMLTAVPVGRFGVQNPEIPVQVDLDTGAVGPGDQHAVGGGAFAGLGLDFSGGAARDRLHRGGRSQARRSRAQRVATIKPRGDRKRGAAARSGSPPSNPVAIASAAQPRAAGRHLG